ncbi:uncharacterized protein PHACADRAFT_194299 [Phanerochaete carnosa HHB-10118-sp]|uniref:Uncharacterized protein n=1 Tax=Phanerochaete carnosa (strain HHB-10118-sp) TaxID=650164 RepID=K5VYP8_PHACS|nr:uncharacterized protein PHACADRAFT_194299 [Phanerochaete carnosa HHB-10118-sp]EKM56713.1 hypothetical protein PHACADRAFT_194299 [Phanerochaete carnosa HHB-10118-sp]
MAGFYASPSWSLRSKHLPPRRLIAVPETHRLRDQDVSVPLFPNHLQPLRDPSLPSVQHHTKHTDSLMKAQKH